MSRIQTDMTFHDNVNSISLEDLIDVWIESFHPYGTVLVICDSGRYFKTLRECGIACSDINIYDNKILTVELYGVDKALDLMDSIHSTGYKPVIFLYDNGKLILDNIEP